MTLDVIPRAADGTVEGQYFLVATLCHYISGEPVPDDDALEARWVPVAQIDSAFSSDTHQLIKFNPLADWTSKEVWD